jgi:hypothetical protein
MLNNKNNSRILASLAALAALTFATSAGAQYVVQYADGQGYGYRTEPLYPYVAQPQYAPRAYPYVPSQPARPAVRAESKTDPALVEELRKRGRKKIEKADAADKPNPPAGKKHVKIDKTIVVREKPIVKNHYRVVDDPPIVIERHISEDQLMSGVGHAEQVAPAGRVIRAEAEVTIIGPDRMSIRLFRKRDGSDANAKATAKAEAKADSKSKSKIR